MEENLRYQDPPSIHSVVNTSGDDLTYAYPNNDIFWVVQRRSLPDSIKTDYQVSHCFTKEEGRLLYASILLWASKMLSASDDGGFSLRLKSGKVIYGEIFNLGIKSESDPADLISLQCDEALRIALMLYKWLKNNG